MIDGLEQSGVISIPTDQDRITYLTSLAADWMVAQLAQKGSSIPRDEAETWVKAGVGRTARQSGFVGRWVGSVGRSCCIFFGPVKCQW